MIRPAKIATSDAAWRRAIVSEPLSPDGAALAFAKDAG